MDGYGSNNNKYHTEFILSINSWLTFYSNWPKAALMKYIYTTNAKELLHVIFGVTHIEGFTKNYHKLLVSISLLFCLYVFNFTVLVQSHSTHQPCYQQQVWFRAKITVNIRVKSNFSHIFVRWQETQL